MRSVFYIIILLLAGMVLTAWGLKPEMFDALGEFKDLTLGFAAGIIIGIVVGRLR